MAHFLQQLISTIWLSICQKSDLQLNANRLQAIAALIEPLSYSCIHADTDLQKGWIHRNEKMVQQSDQDKTGSV